MIPYPAPLLGVGGARTGLPGVHLLEVQDVNGNTYFWSDRGTEAWPSVLRGESQLFVPWLLAAGPFVYNRSQVTNAGSFTVQNVSGTSLARDVETILRATTLEGAVFVYRYWNAAAQAAWIYLDGTLTLSGATDDTATFRSKPFINEAEDEAPMEQYCETCQLNWGGPRCGSTEPTECSYSFQTCQVVERPMISLNSYEKNYGETTDPSPLLVINRSRRI